MLNQANPRGWRLLATQRGDMTVRIAQYPAEQTLTRGKGEKEEMKSKDSSNFGCTTVTSIKRNSADFFVIRVTPYVEP
jgi:hypothetical protein